jgi:hypothetical protein
MEREFEPVFNSFMSSCGALAISLASMMPSWFASSTWMTGGSGGGGGGPSPGPPCPSGGPPPGPCPNAALPAAHKARGMIHNLFFMVLLLSVVVCGRRVARLLSMTFASHC